MKELTALLARIQKRCPSGTWSNGVKLARAGGVVVESRDPEEIVLRVRAPGRPVPPTVVLYPTEGEWDCDCNGRVNPCEHIAAAAITLSQPDGGEAVPTAATTWARLLYRFSRAAEGLELRRVILEADGRETPLDGSLAALMNNPARASTLQTEQADLQADQLLLTRSRGVLAPEKLNGLLKVLLGSRQVLLDGRPVIVTDETVLPRARVEDRGEDIGLTIARDPRLTDVVSPGVGFGDDALFLLGELDLAGGWWQNLPIVKLFGPAQRGELSTKVLPDLMKRMHVEMRTDRLPRVVRDLPPRVLLEMNQVGASLSVLPKLVYGSPPQVRIDEGKMVYLRGAVPVRDEAAERRLVEKLRNDLNLMPGRRANFDGPDAARFVESVKRWRGDLTGDAAKLVSPPVRLEPRMRVETTPGVEGGLPLARFELTFEVVAQDAGARPDGVGKTVDAGAVLRAFRDGMGLVPIEGGGWAPLPRDFLVKHGQKIADLLAARESDGRVGNHALPMLGSLCTDLQHPPPAGLERLEPLVAGFEQLPAFTLPADLNAELRPYQRDGVNWLAFLRSTGMGGILADDMGLGKTLQTICVLGTKSLVVCPTSVLPNWEAELRRFRPGLRVSVYHGPQRALDDSADVTLTSYALLRLDADRLTQRRWGTVVLDEAQAIKNPDSQVARAAYSLGADFRLALSGTPVENRLEELWSLCHFTNRGLLGGRSDFDERYARPMADGDCAAGERLRARLKPFVLRRLKRQVAPELPPRTESVLRVALDERERGVYDAVRAATQAEVIALLEQGGGMMKALEALLRLRQAACHPALVPGQEARTSSKTETLVNALLNATGDGHKALVFSQWTSLLDLLEPRLRDEEIGFVRLDGSTRDRGAVVEKFQSPDGPPVMLLSLKAGGTGLNLTAADHVFLVDPWWNPAVEAQAADRAHRIGQDRPVFVYRLVSVETVEERILTLQQRKKALADAALDEAGAAARLTREDLLALLQ